MKKTMGFFTLLGCLLLVASLASATPIPPGSPLMVERDANRPWVIHLKGDPADLARQNFLVQFLPDELREHAVNKIAVPGAKVSENEKIFEMDKTGLELGLIGFNFADTDRWTQSNIWLGIPSSYVKMGHGISMTYSTKDPNIPLSGGHHFLNLYGPYANAGAFKAPRTISGSFKKAGGGGKAGAGSGGKDGGCTNCEKKILEEVKSVKEDTVAIRESVGDIDKNEPVEEQTVQKKLRIMLPIIKKMGPALGEGKPDKNGKKLSVHEKLGEPTKPGATVMAEVEKTNATMGEPTKPGETVMTKLNKIENATAAPWWKNPVIWMLGAVLALLLALLLGAGKKWGTLR